MLQRNGRLTNLSAYNTIPRYNNSALRNSRDNGCDCGCDAQTYNRDARNNGCGCGCDSQAYNLTRDARNNGCCEKESSCDECGYSYNTANDGCGCKNDNRNIHLAISSIGVHKWCDIYDLEQGFRAGTIFRQLDLPFCGAKGGRL